MSDLIFSIRLSSYFTNVTRTLPCQEETKSYITQVLANPKTDLIGKSITLTFSEARFNYAFEGFQKVGDWVLLARTTFPEAVNNASEEYYNAIAQNAYYTCYKILNRQWKLYEELSDLFPKLVEQLSEKLYISSDNFNGRGTKLSGFSG